MMTAELVFFPTPPTLQIQLTTCLPSKFPGDLLEVFHK